MAMAAFGSCALHGHNADFQSSGSCNLVEVSRRRDLALSDRRIPSLADGRWESWAMPLLSFLEEARDWKAIGAWARTSDTGTNAVRQMLAWAEDHHRAESFYRGGILYWTVPRVSSVRLLDSDLGEDLGEGEEGAASRCVRDGRGEREDDSEAMLWPDARR
jgi:hypothetical protein